MLVVSYFLHTSRFGSFIDLFGCFCLEINRNEFRANKVCQFISAEADVNA